MSNPKLIYHMISDDEIVTIHDEGTGTIATPDSFKELPKSSVAMFVMTNNLKSKLTKAGLDYLAEELY